MEGKQCCYQKLLILSKKFFIYFKHIDNIFDSRRRTLVASENKLAPGTPDRVSAGRHHHTTTYKENTEHTPVVNRGPYTSSPVLSEVGACLPNVSPAVSHVSTRCISPILANTSARVPHTSPPMENYGMMQTAVTSIPKNTACCGCFKTHEHGVHATTPTFHKSNNYIAEHHTHNVHTYSQSPLGYFSPARSRLYHPQHTSAQTHTSAQPQTYPNQRKHLLPNEPTELHHTFISTSGSGYQTHSSSSLSRNISTDRTTSSMLPNLPSILCRLFIKEIGWAMQVNLSPIMYFMYLIRTLVHYTCYIMCETNSALFLFLIALKWRGDCSVY